MATTPGTLAMILLRHARAIKNGDSASPEARAWADMILDRFNDP